jgi:hypothetical protein
MKNHHWSCWLYYHCFFPASRSFQFSHRLQIGDTLDTPYPCHLTGHSNNSGACSPPQLQHFPSSSIRYSSLLHTLDTWPNLLHVWHWRGLCTKALTGYTMNPNLIWEGRDSLSKNSSMDEVNFFSPSTIQVSRRAPTTPSMSSVIILCLYFLRHPGNNPLLFFDLYLTRQAS